MCSDVLANQRPVTFLHTEKDSKKQCQRRPHNFLVRQWTLSIEIEMLHIKFKKSKVEYGSHRYIKDLHTLLHFFVIEIISQSTLSLLYCHMNDED